VRTVATTLLVLGLGLASRAHAQGEDCPEPSYDPEFTPASGAQGVTLGAPIRVRFPAGLFDDPITGPAAADEVTSSLRLVSCGSLRCLDGADVPGRVDLVGDSVFFVPSAPLTPASWYAGEVTLDDVASPFDFRTGTLFDTGPPDLARIRDVTPARHTSCELDGGGFRLDVTFAPAQDDGPEGDIEYLLYLTRGPDVIGPQLRSRVRGYATGEIVMALVLEPREAVSPVCVAVIAVDGTGRVDDDTAPVCLDPVQGNYFEPLCTVTAPGTPRSAPVAVLLAACAAAVAVRARRRPS
jgi:hypothetical protein